MREVGILEAKTNLSALVAEVEQTGESVALTRHGKRVARITRDTDPRYVNSARRMGPEAWRKFLDYHWAKLQAEAEANPALLEPFDLRAERDAIE